MRSFFQIVVILISLAAFGLAKLKFETSLSESMVAQKLIQPPIKRGTSLKLGQTGAAVALGGLRSLIASIWSLKAYNHFEELDWIKLEESYEIATTLQPQSTIYWKTAAWHLHTNASVYYNENADLSPMRRGQMRSKYIQKGSTLLETGITENPDDWILHLELARLWSDSYKKPNLPKSIRHYKDALACESLPQFERAKLKRFLFYTMTRSSEHSQEAYDMGLALYRKSPRNRTPNLTCCIFALQNALEITGQKALTESELFPDHASQLKWLQNYWDHRKNDYPMHGVRAAINKLTVNASS